SWPKVLEQALLKRGFNVEIANLGRPGAGPRDYADVAEKAIPTLRPDLVIIGMLQGDDLGQSKPAFLQPKGPDNFTFVSRIKSVYPNLTRVAKATVGALRGQPTIPIAAEWERQRRTIISGFTGEERERYEKLDERIKQLFLSGKLSPARINYAIK